MFRQVDWLALCDLVAEDALSAAELFDADIITLDEHAYISESVRMISELAEIGFGDEAEQIFGKAEFGSSALSVFYDQMMVMHRAPIDSEGETLEAVGNHLNLTRERVRQITASSYAKIRERFAHAQEFVQEQHAGPTWLPAGVFADGITYAGT